MEAMNVPWYEIEYFRFCFVFVFIIFGGSAILAIIYGITQLIKLILRRLNNGHDY